MNDLEKLNLDFGFFPFDLNQLIKLLKRDLEDDWFADPIDYEDKLRNKKEIVEYFEKNILDNHGSFKPLHRIVLNIPKQTNTLRYSLETCIYDRIAYHYFGAILLKYFDKFISRRVLSHRFNEIFYNKGKDLFLSRTEQWKKFEEFIRVDAEGKTILFTDIQNYFENVNIDILKQTLLDYLKKIEVNGTTKFKIKCCIDSLCNCFTEWTYNKQYGLPQNRDISSFLANIYMLPVDSVMNKFDYDYYRYMDDIRVICKDVYQARKILKILSIELRKIGLTLNGHKTSILLPETQDHQNYLYPSIDLDRIDSLLNSKKRPIVTLAFNEIRDELIRILEKGDFNSKEFRFYINRIVKIALCKEIKKPSDFFTPITEKIIEFISLLPYAMDQYYTYLVSVDLSEEQLEVLQEYLIDKEKALYGWQNLYLWKIFILKNYKNNNLINCAIDSISNEANIGTNAGAFLYLGKFGLKENRLLILNKLKSENDFFMQRYILISIQELPFKDVKSSSMYIKPESLGIFQNLKQYSNISYCTPPRELKYSDLINEISIYV